MATTEVDWSTVISDAQANLAELHTEALKGGTDLSTALGNVSEHFGSQISSALTGFATGAENSLYGGWYGGDDGYVFGLFGGTVTDPANGISETGSTLGEISQALQAGNTEQAFSDFNAWSLETLDHSLKPLLAPLLDETSKGVTTYSIPVELSQIHTNLLEQFGSYDELKSASETVLSPEISAFFAFTQDLDGIKADFAAGDTSQGLSDLHNLSSDVFGAFLNCYDFGTNPYNGAEELFPGLLNDGSLLQSLLLTWPEQIVTALGSLGESTSSVAADAVGSTAPDVVAGLLSY